MQHVIGMDDNTKTVLLALIGTIPGVIAAVFAYLAHAQVKTPSGARLGEVAERAQHLAEVNTALTLGIHSAVGAQVVGIDDVHAADTKMRNGGDT